MKIGHNIYEYWIHKYNYRDEKKRKQFKKLHKQGDALRIYDKEYKDSKYFVYHTSKPIKIVKG